MAKTRLIPALGAEGAAELQRRMTEQAVGRAWAVAATLRETRLIVAHDGGTAREMGEWLGPLSFQQQVLGDLGMRLKQAVMAARECGHGKIVVIGTDCPALSEEVLRDAFETLDSCDVVMGPTEDGGYYLIGMNDPQPGLFDAIPWSTAEVFAATWRAAEAAGLRVLTLPRLADVDEPEDVARASELLAAGVRVSVIIPVLNEAAALPVLLPLLQGAAPLEILVADGGSNDESVAVARRHGVEVIQTPAGRARQMNEAARRARGEFLLFLHADTRPPADFPEIIARKLTAGVAAGAFRFALAERFFLRGMVEWLTRQRGSWLGMPYGDQGLFVRRSVFEAVGGFPEWPILEDVELVKRLRRFGAIVITSESAPTSARRWREGGVLRTWMRHQLILVGYRLGVAAERLARLR